MLKTEQNSSLATTLVVAKFTSTFAMIFAMLKSELNAQQTNYWGKFVELKLKLSYSFSCFKIHNSHCHVQKTRHTLE